MTSVAIDRIDVFATDRFKASLEHAVCVLRSASGSARLTIIEGFNGWDHPKRTDSLRPSVGQRFNTNRM